MSDQSVCVELRDAVQAGDDKLVDVALAEGNRRRLTAARCASLWQQHDREASAAGASALAGLTLAAVAGKYARSGGAPASGGDREWDWDQVASASGLPVWICRGVQTAQFAPEVLCVGPKMDMRWPGLAAPR